MQLKNLSDEVIAEMGDNSALLGHYGPHEHYTIHVVDSSPGFNFEDFEDTSKVEKFKISEDAYAKRDDTFRTFKKKMIAKDPNFMNKNKKQIDENHEEEEAKVINIGDR